MNNRFPPRRRNSVVPLFPNRRSASSPYDELAKALMIKQFREGTLPEGVFLALLELSSPGPGGGHE